MSSKIVFFKESEKFIFFEIQNITKLNASFVASSIKNCNKNYNVLFSNIISKYPHLKDKLSKCKLVMNLYDKIERYQFRLIKKCSLYILNIALRTNPFILLHFNVKMNTCKQILNICNIDVSEEQQHYALIIQSLLYHQNKGYTYISYAKLKEEIKADFTDNYQPYKEIEKHPLHGLVNDEEASISEIYKIAKDNKIEKAFESSRDYFYLLNRIVIEESAEYGHNVYLKENYTPDVLLPSLIKKKL
jgi:hypothetical protein